MKRVLRMALAAICLSVAACGGAAPIGLSPQVEATNENLPTPSVADFTKGVRDYYVGPQDKISIEVFGVPELTRQVQVDSTGQLSFPLIGVVSAGGLTPAELARSIEQKLRLNFVKDPQVTVNLVEAVNRQITVDGQVNRPGLYSIAGRMSLIRSVAVAGGVAEYAKMDDVVVMREVNGKKYAGLYNLAAIRRGNYEDPEIFPNDIIIVGDSQQRRLFNDLLQVVPLLTTPLILLLRN